MVPVIDAGHVGSRAASFAEGLGAATGGPDEDRARSPIPEPIERGMASRHAVGAGMVR
jgi:hypothetical protein